jgi:hypothetical protein
MEPQRVVRIAKESLLEAGDHYPVDDRYGQDRSLPDACNGDSLKSVKFVLQERPGIEARPSVRGTRANKGAAKG